MPNIPYKFNPVITPLPSITAGVNGLVVSSGANLISSGLIMSGAYLKSNYSMRVYSKGIAKDTVVRSGGSCHVSSGGTASGIYLSSGCHLYLSSGGTAAKVYAEHANCLNLTSAFISGATVRGGMLNLGEDNASEPVSRFVDITASTAQIMVSSHCKVYSMCAMPGGYVEIVGGAYAENTVARGGIVMFNVSGSGIGLGVFSGGTGIIAGGAKLEQALFVYSGGTAVIHNGGSCGGGIISSGGTLVISSGGTAANITSAPGAVIIHVNG